MTKINPAAEKHEDDSILRHVNKVDIDPSVAIAFPGYGIDCAQSKRAILGKVNLIRFTEQIQCNNNS